jgi:hypothetical protein
VPFANRIVRIEDGLIVGEERGVGDEHVSEKLTNEKIVDEKTLGEQRTSETVGEVRGVEVPRGVAAKRKRVQR